jgi:predicted ATPase
LGHTDRKLDDDDRAAGSLGGFLKALRLAAGLTQEELAERSGISARSVSDAERGLRSSVHRDTARRLASALGLEDLERRRFEALASGRHSVWPAGPGHTALPAVPTPLLGRSRELESVKATLLATEVRLLTLTGPGGIGKTRLALEAAREVQGAFADGVFFVSLGELKDPSLVAPQLAKAIGVVESGPRLEELLIAHFARRCSLIVLDTFEHLTPAAPLVYSLLLNSVRTRLLVTSRSALRLRGEHELPVPPLDFPSQIGAAAPEEVVAWPAPALFWERACAVRPDLEFDAPTALLVADICQKLDGLPLAIELAAARVRHLPLAAVRDQLDHRLQLLVGGPLDLPRRQRAITDTVAWSHDLLGSREKRLFRRLAVFAGGWSLDAVEAVCGPAAEVGSPLEGVSALVDQSLAMVGRDRSDARYEMLDVVAEYAALRLRDAGESEEIGRRHALHFLAMSEEAERHLVGTGHEEWFRRLDVERGNLRRAMAWTLERGDSILALRYTVALWRYWRRLGEFAEGRRWSDAALAVQGKAPASLRAKALWAAAALAYPQADHLRMVELAVEARKLAGESEDPMDLRNALTIEGMVAMCQGRYADAVEPYRECVAVCRRLGTSWQLATSHLNLATALLHTGGIEEADGSLKEGLRIYQALGDDIFAARVTNMAAHAALVRRDLGLAGDLGRTALSIFAEQDERQGIAEGLETLAAVAAASSQAHRAAVLAGAAASIRQTIASRPTTFDLAITGGFLEQARRGAGEKRWRTSLGAGGVLGSEAAVAYAFRARFGRSGTVSTRPATNRVRRFTLS